MINLRRALFALILGCWALVFGAAAAPVIPIAIVVDENNAPFMSDEGGVAVGIYPALIAAAFERMQQPVSIEAKPWKRALVELEAAKSGVAGLYRNDSRAAHYDFSEPIFSENVGVYHQKTRPINYRTLADLEGMHVGVIRSWLYGDDFDAAQKAGTIVAVATSSDRINFLKLAHGRLDAVLSVEQSATAVIAKEKLTNIERSAQFFRVNHAYLAFSKTARQSGLLTRFNATIAEMKRDGTIERIVTQALAE